MKTVRRMTTAAMLFAFSAFATTMQAQADPAPAANPVLKAIPDDALGFAIINNLGQTDKAISKWAAAVQGEAPSMLTMLKLQLGIQDGLDENGSVVIALLPDKAGEAAKPASYPVVFLPVTDYKKFVAQFQPDDAAAETTGVTIAGHAMVVGHRDSFAVFTLPDHQAQLAKVIASNKGVDSLLGSFEPWIGRHRISIVATPTGTKMALQAASAGLNQAQAAVPLLQTAQQTAQFNSILQAYQTIIAKAGGEMEMFGVGLRLGDSSNLSIDSHTTLVAGAAWAAAMKDSKASEESRFAGIQAQPFAIAFEGIWPEKWSDAMADWSASLTAAMSTVNGGPEMDQQQRKTYVDAMRSMMKGLHAISFVMAAPKPGGSMYDGVVASMKVDNAPRFLVQYQKSMEHLLEVTKGQKNSPFEFSEVKKIEIDGQSGLAITMDLSGMLASMNNPATAKLMPLLFGPTGKLTMRILSADDHTLIAAYGSEDHAKEALAAYKNPQSSLASDPDVATTLKLLPPHAQWIGLLSVNGFVDMIRGLMSGVAPGGAPIKLPEFPGTAPIGFAAEMNSLGLDTQLVVPAVTIASMNKFFRAITGPHAAIPPGP